MKKEYISPAYDFIFLKNEDICTTSYADVYVNLETNEHENDEQWWTK